MSPFEVKYIRGIGIAEQMSVDLQNEFPEVKGLLARNL